MDCDCRDLGLYNNLLCLFTSPFFRWLLFHFLLLWAATVLCCERQPQSEREGYNESR